MVATAPVAAGTFLKILIGRNAPQLERLVNELLDALLHFVHFLLRIDETLGDRVAKKSFPFGLKRRDLSAIQRQSLVLLLVEGTTFLGKALILLLGFRVRHKGINPLPDALELGLLDDGFAKLQGFLLHRVIDLRTSLHDDQHASSLPEAQVPVLTFVWIIL
jgi:hypothetical protein